MTSLSEHRMQHLVQANVAATQHESEAARYEVEAVRDRLVRRLSTHIDKFATFYQHADPTGRPYMIHRAELYMFNVEQLKEHERLVGEELATMLGQSEANLRAHRQSVKNLTADCDALARERGALAAHAEQLRGAFHGCTQHGDDYEACIQYSGTAPCADDDDAAAQRGELCSHKAALENLLGKLRACEQSHKNLARERNALQAKLDRLWEAFTAITEQNGVHEPADLEDSLGRIFTDEDPQG